MGPLNIPSISHGTESVIWEKLWCYPIALRWPRAWGRVGMFLRLSRGIGDLQRCLWKNGTRESVRDTVGHTNLSGFCNGWPQACLRSLSPKILSCPLVSGKKREAGPGLRCCSPQELCRSTRFFCSFSFMPWYLNPHRLRTLLYSTCF